MSAMTYIVSSLYHHLFFSPLLMYPWVGAGETNNPEMPMGKDKASQMLVVLMKVTQSCLTLCDPKNYTVYGILQARILEWVTFPFSMGSSQPRDWTQVSNIPGGILYQLNHQGSPNDSLVKNLPPVQETQETHVRFLGQEDPMEKGKVTNSSILVWWIPRTV